MDGKIRMIQLMLMAKCRWQNTDDKNVDNKMWMDSETDKMRMENRAGQYAGDKMREINLRCFLTVLLENKTKFFIQSQIRSWHFYAGRI